MSLTPRQARFVEEYLIDLNATAAAKRAAMREEDSGTTTVDADKPVFDELLWIWHAAQPVEHAPGQCAACGTAFEPPAMSLT